MNQNKTKPTKVRVQEYLAAIEDKTRRKDCEALAQLMTKATKQPPTMWGSSIVGFGSYHYKYESGREGEMCLVGFASRKGEICVYGLNGIADRQALFARLGKYKAGKGCLYIKSLADIDKKILEKLIVRAAAEKNRQNP
jgi:hypothetical protein